MCAALLVAPWRGHVDDVDAQLYRVVIRNLSRDRAWFDLRFLPGLFPRFREHLPFGFWPGALAERLFGAWAVDAAYALCTVGAIWAAARIARRLAGAHGELAAVLLLGTCESIWQYGGRPLLDPPLLFFATLAAGAALEDRFVLAGAAGAAAALVKGPFGLLPLAGVVLARRRGFLALLAACVPLALFLVVDPAGGWRSGYLHAQLLASASGARADGVTAWWFPLAVIAGRFWPGLPFAVAAPLVERRSRTLARAAAFAALLLCLPHRKWGNHAYVVFPLLGALAGAGAARLVARVEWRTVARGCAVLALCAWIAALAGAGRLALRPPCAFSTQLAAALDALPPGRPLLVVTPRPDALPLAELAAERDLIPSPAPALPEVPEPPDAVAVEGTALPAAWRVAARGGGWLYLRAR